MPRPASLLAALTAQEVREFLPEPLWGELRSVAAQFTHLDTNGLDAAGYHRALVAANPEVLISCWKTPRLPAQLPPDLRYVCYLAGSIKGQITRAQLSTGLQVTNWGDSISRTVAEMALLHILSGLRRTTHWTIAMHQQGAWKDAETETASLFGRRVGLHGFGRIARELLLLLRPFNCEVSAYAPEVDDRFAAHHGIKVAASLEMLFAENDIIVELAPLIPATTGIITEKLLRLIRPGGLFVNVGRGAVVDEAALLRVAREGKINVGLDVYGVEPLPADSGFRGLPNVSLSPHIAGPTTDRRRDAGEFALINLRAYAAGRPLAAVITPAIYDTST